VRNLITDVPGVLVGCAHDERVASGTTVVLFETPVVGAVATPGGAPALRDGALLAPEMTVEKVDAFVLSGGSAFGLDASGGAMGYLASIGRGIPFESHRVPIAPGAALFDLTHGGDKAWGHRSPYGDLGYAAALGAAEAFALGSAGAGYGAWTYDLKGGLGSASAVSQSGFRVGALAAVNAAGRVTRGTSPHFWAASYERDGEFGGLGEGLRAADAFTLALTSDRAQNTTLVVIATDAAFSKAQLTRIAIMASAGFAHAIRPAFGPGDGDVLFAAATARASAAPAPRDLTDIGALAAECVARAIARGVYEASSLAVCPERPSWREIYGSGGENRLP
jgi:D-aminopeptidase